MNISPIASHDVRSNYAKAPNFGRLEDVQNPSKANTVVKPASGRIGTNYFRVLMQAHYIDDGSEAVEAAKKEMENVNVFAINMGDFGLKGKKLTAEHDNAVWRALSNDSVMGKLPKYIHHSFTHTEEGDTLLHLKSDRTGYEGTYLITTGRDPIDYSDFNAEMIVEGTGKILDSAKARELKAASGLAPYGIVGITAPTKETTNKDDSAMPYGEKNAPMVNPDISDRTPELRAKMLDRVEASGGIISNASCTTNSVSSVVDALNQKFALKSVILKTVHAGTNSQKLLDSKNCKADAKDRQSVDNIIPTTTGAAKAMKKVVPNMGNVALSGAAYRVPTADGSITTLDIRFPEGTVTSTEDVVEYLKQYAADLKAKGSYAFRMTTDEESDYTSKDVVGEPYGGVVLTNSIKVDPLCPDQVTMDVAYDNEHSYTHRYATMMGVMAGVLVAGKAAGKYIANQVNTERLGQLLKNVRA